MLCTVQSADPNVYNCRTGTNLGHFNRETPHCAVLSDPAEMVVAAKEAAAVATMAVTAFALFFSVCTCCGLLSGVARA